MIVIKAMGPDLTGRCCASSASETAKRRRWMWRWTGSAIIDTHNANYSPIELLDNSLVDIFVACTRVTHDWNLTTD